MISPAHVNDATACALRGADAWVADPADTYAERMVKLADNVLANPAAEEASKAAASKLKEYFAP